MSLYIWKRKALPLFLTLILTGGLTACGQADPKTEAAPAPEPATLEQVQEDPFAAYFDLSGLTQETLDKAVECNLRWKEQVLQLTVAEDGRLDALESRYTVLA